MDGKDTDHLIDGKGEEADNDDQLIQLTPREDNTVVPVDESTQPENAEPQNQAVPDECNLQIPEENPDQNDTVNIQIVSDSETQPSTNGPPAEDQRPVASLPWQCTDAYRPRPAGDSCRPSVPVPMGLPPPPYQALPEDQASAQELQSMSEEAPPEYPGPPRGFTPAHPFPSCPTGTRTPSEQELQRQRVVGRLMVLEALLNSVNARQRGQQASGAGNVRPVARSGVERVRNRMLGTLVGIVILIVVFTAVGIATKAGSSSDSSDSYPSYHPYTPRPKTCANFVCYHGYCRNNFQGPYCLCRQYYSGIHCEKYTTHEEHQTCRQFDCGRHGTCVEGAYGPHCTCAPHHHGSRCQYDNYDWLSDRFGTTPRTPPTTKQPVNQCHYRRCYNGGTCHELFQGWYCSCPPNFRGYKCQERMDRFSERTTRTPLLVYSVEDDIFVSGMIGNVSRSLGLKSIGQHPRAIDIDYKREMLFALDNTSGSIYHWPLDQNGGNPKRLATPKTKVVTDLAFDWINDNIYWTEQDRNKVNVMNIFRKHTRTLLTPHSPSEIVVDPRKEQGWLYYTSENERIYKSGMDGSSDGAHWETGGQVVGLTIDYDNNKLYWIDITLEEIFSSDLNGFVKRSLYRSELLMHATSLTFYNNQLFWSYSSSQRFGQIQKMSTQDVSAETVINKPGVKNVAIFAISRQPNETSPCGRNNGGCSYLCLASPQQKYNGEYYSCDCPDGMVPHGRDCRSLL